jgi:hypothetical protein
MIFNRNDIGERKSFPLPASLRMYRLNVSPQWAKKVARMAEKAGVTPEIYITEAVRATLGGTESDWLMEEKANGSNS